MIKCQVFCDLVVGRHRQCWGRVTLYVGLVGLCVSQCRAMCTRGLPSILTDCAPLLRARGCIQVPQSTPLVVRCGAQGLGRIYVLWEQWACIFCCNKIPLNTDFAKYDLMAAQI